MHADDEAPVDELHASHHHDQTCNANATAAAARPSKKVFVVGPATLINARTHDWADWRQPAPLVPGPRGRNSIAITDLDQLGPEWEFLDLGVNLDDYWRAGPQRAVLRHHIQKRFAKDIG